MVLFSINKSFSFPGEDRDKNKIYTCAREGRPFAFYLVVGCRERSTTVVEWVVCGCYDRRRRFGLSTVHGVVKPTGVSILFIDPTLSLQQF